MYLRWTSGHRIFVSKRRSRSIAYNYSKVMILHNMHLFATKHLNLSKMYFLKFQGRTIFPDFKNGKLKCKKGDNRLDKIITLIDLIRN